MPYGECVNKPKLSVKWDGAPAIVFGTNPANGKFFVGTKSVFNKVKVKICYSQEDIDKHYKGNVADILRLCLRNLPRLSGIVQASTSSVSAEVLFIALTLWSIVSPVRSVVILSLLHTLLIPRFLRMLLGVVASIYCLHWALTL